MEQINNPMNKYEGFTAEESESFLSVLKEELCGGLEENEKDDLLKFLQHELGNNSIGRHLPAERLIELLDEEKFSKVKNLLEEHKEEMRGLKIGIGDIEAMVCRFF